MSPKIFIVVAALPLCSAFHAAAPLAPRAVAPRPALVYASASAASDAAPIAPQSTRPAVLPVLARTASTFALSLLVPAVAGAGAGKKVATFFQQFGLPDWAVLALISATPAIELRGGVPVGNWMGISPALTFVICLLGNMAPIAPMLLALRSSFFKKLAAPLLARAEKKLAGLPTGQSRTLALALFVGVPAPGTGAWTGAIIAYLLDMPFATAMGSIFAGVVLAGAIMTVLTLAGKWGALAALGVLVAGGVGAIMNAAKAEASDEPPADEPTAA